jgi:NAD(P)H-dependent flavin oxidoreductase YrpB (nitropropane dioxygenase family)
MALPPVLRDRLRLPVIGSPLFIISIPDLVIAQCKAGIIGAFPGLNARPASVLDEWLHRITEALAAKTWMTFAGVGRPVPMPAIHPKPETERAKSITGSAAPSSKPAGGEGHASWRALHGLARFGPAPAGRSS